MSENKTIEMRLVEAVVHAQIRGASAIFAGQEKSMQFLREALKSERVSEYDKERILKYLEHSSKTQSKIEDALHGALDAEQDDSVHKKLH